MKKEVKTILIIAAITGVILLSVYLMKKKKLKEEISYFKEVENVDSSTSVETAAGSLNNPGNIKKSATKYQGEIDSPSNTFKSFQSLAYGYRAMIQLLMSYEKRGFNTLDKVINRYAPASDKNPVENYIKFITDTTGIQRTTDLTPIINSENVMLIVGAMTKFEQGIDFDINPEALRYGYELS